MLTIRRFQKGDEEILSVMIRRTLREVNYTSPKSDRSSAPARSCRMARQRRRSWRPS
ncbi:MAG: hypothetical protein KHW60_03330 [Oscillibacter sp.]|nr:hypothetical protein [Oscillibacter sp.]